MLTGSLSDHLIESVASETAPDAVGGGRCWIVGSKSAGGSENQYFFTEKQ
jgi:hypothetical protein